MFVKHSLDLTLCNQTRKFLVNIPLLYLIKAFQNLGRDLGNQQKDSLVKYVMNLYCKGKPITISNLCELRWFLFSKYQTELIGLPPTMKAFE